MTNRITVEENANRVKIVVPLERLWPFWITYSILLIGWLLASFWAASILVSFGISGNVGFEGLFLVAWIVILVIIGIFWFYAGRMIWRRWQYYTSNREILFFYPDKLIVRRPLSLLGITEAYDRQYVSAFRYDNTVNAAAFDYGSYRIPVGPTLTAEEAGALIGLVNERFFADQMTGGTEDYIE